MKSRNSVGIFGFLLIVAILRLIEADTFGFFLFLLISLVFLLSYALDELVKTAPKKSNENRKKIFQDLSSPRLVSRNEGNSEITTLVVPSLEFFNEMKNDI